MVRASPETMRKPRCFVLLEILWGTISLGRIIFKAGHAPFLVPLRNGLTDYIIMRSRNAGYLRDKRELLGP